MDKATINAQLERFRKGFPWLRIVAPATPLRGIEVLTEAQQDEAIRYANRKTPGRLMDVITRKRYDADDMIILREKDFTHY